MNVNSQAEYLRFLIAAQGDPDLRAQLRRASRGVRTVNDLVAFAAGHGFRFGTADVPLDAARRPPVTAMQPSRSSLR
ncbi:MAG TPA: Nif11-like leader peptide family natural product precursor [Azospirillum sp.]|nr:Nif11-like leader peptide family natural product precursor [Azospirillum sp.]